jgi:predicted nucleic acid-binding protein
MTARVFIDSSVLVCSRDASERTKQARAHEWMAHLSRSASGRLSVQVMNEFYVTVTRKLKPGLSREQATRDLQDLSVWHPLGVDARLMTSAWDIENRHGLSFWDALVVAAARELGCDFLLTEDLQDGQRFGELTVVDPFRHTPQSLG